MAHVAGQDCAAGTTTSHPLQNACVRHPRPLSRACGVEQEARTMPQTITGYFDTRRDAEMTVEHLVQDHGLDRKRVEVMAEGEENSAGTVVSGADAADAAAGEAPEGVRRGRIMVRAEVDDALMEVALASFRECNVGELKISQD